MTLARWKVFGVPVAMAACRARVRGDEVERDVRAADGQGWRPAVDVLETDEGFLLRAEIPGVDAADLDLRVERGTLTLAGERNPGWETHDERIRYRERGHGRFRRRFRLPRSVDVARVAASCERGVLEVRLPKLETARARRIPVKAA